CPYIPNRQRREWCVRVHQNGDDRFAWNNVLEKLDALALKVPRLIGQARDIAAGMTEARDQASAHGIAKVGEHDRDSRGRGLQRLCRESPESRNQYIRLGSDEIHRQWRQPLWPALRGTVLKRHIVTVRVAQLVKPF